MKNTQGHHLILGELVDYITGETIEDTHDERYRQKLARILVEHKGYLKKEIESGRKLLITAADKKAVVKIDYTIKLADQICIIVKYGPGSLVTRHRPALAASRLVAPYQVPVVVVTNGEDADILDGATGKVISMGLESIPAKAELIDKIANIHFDPISTKRAEMESKIIYAFEVDGSCMCDDSTCRL
ncbi:MAG: type I restriction enzyme HsdR N-terminal domain-containing protein [Thermodesulfobacteriota bacterium]|nr:type I restriction enzyme HsdR N-terminal domain-containing protein [Thermodesulfobacteriota bacterium]